MYNFLLSVLLDNLSNGRKPDGNHMTNILIIDDEPQIRLVLRELFELEGYTVTEASNGSEGVALYHKKQTDLIITDLFMPDQEGLETIYKLKKEYPMIKIIAMSGGGGMGYPQSHLESARLLGAIATFAKPVRRETLLKTIRDLC